MDVFGNILEHIVACPEQRDVYLKQAEGGDMEIGEQGRGVRLTAPVETQS